jgi:hypothetical protein
MHPTVSYNSRFTYAPPAVYPGSDVVGSAWGPAIMPDQMVTVDTNSVGYLDLFTSLDPTGAQGRGRFGGTFVPPVTGALKLGG